MSRFSRLPEENAPRYKYCSRCRKPMSNNILTDICPACQKDLLYKDVREYIEQNDTTEFEVADHFNIDISLVREWIKEGLLEYRKGHTENN